MSIRTLLRFRNPDSTADLNDRFKGLFNKGVISGGSISPVTGVLRVDLAPFFTVGSDGMFVREDSESTRLDVNAGQKNFIVIRQEYIANGDPVVSIENLVESAFLVDGAPGQQGFDNPTLIVFGTVTLSAGATSVSSNDIDFSEADKVDPLGRLAFRGVLSSDLDLPPAGLNSNRSGDFYIITDGSGDEPRLFAWNGVDWVNITSVGDVLTSLNAHRQNLLPDEKHLTDDQAAAMLSTAPPLSSSNRVVADADPRLPTQDENDALAGNFTGSSSDLEPETPSDTNRYITSSKIIAAPTEKAFASLPPTVGSNSVVELTPANGPYFVGRPTDPEALAGTAQQYFAVYDDDVAEDSEFLNEQFQAVRVVGVFTDSGITQELNPQTDGRVNALGFWDDSTDSLFLKTEALIDRQPFRIAYGKQTRLGDLLPQLLMRRGPQGGQIDTRLSRLLTGTPNAQFPDASWDPTVAPGAVVAFNTISSRFEKADPLGGLNPIGVRGNSNNLIQEGLLTLAVSTFTANLLYADKANPGGLTTTPNEWFIGRAISSTQLLVNMSAIPLTPSATVVPPTVFDNSLFDPSVQPGQVVGFNSSTSKFERAVTSNPALYPIGVRGNSDNVIQSGAFTALSGSPYTPGIKYYASDITAGALDTTPNDWLIGEAITTTTLLISANQIPIYRQFVSEHDADTGFHKFAVGDAAAQVAIANPVAGMIFIRTDTSTPRIDYYDGVAWQIATTDVLVEDLFNNHLALLTGAGISYVPGPSGDSNLLDAIVALAESRGFTTGDIKITFKSSETGWVNMNDGTIGNGVSGATTRANEDTRDLYVLLWNQVSNTWAPVTGGRGANADADFDAGKPMQLPASLGRAVAGAGAGAGLTSRALGESAGAESVTVPRDGWGTSGIGLGSGPAGRLAVTSGFGEGSEFLESLRNAGVSQTLASIPPTAYRNVLIKL